MSFNLWGSASPKLASLACSRYGRLYERIYGIVKLSAQAMKLNAGERAMLAGLLLESLEPHAEDDVNAAWREEVERRIHELDQGTVRPVPWEQVRARLHGTP